jgi:hypothetical protein
MSQPPVLPIMSRSLTRLVPFATPKTFVQQIAIAGSLAVEFDTLQGFADSNALLAGAFPGANVAKPHAVGPYLDAMLFADQITSLRVEYAVDQGASYRQITPDTNIPASTGLNISGLRITGRFTRVTLLNTSGVLVNVEFGVYVRSA